MLNLDLFYIDRSHQSAPPLPSPLRHPDMETSSEEEEDYLVDPKQVMMPYYYSEQVGPRKGACQHSTVISIPHHTISQTSQHESIHLLLEESLLHVYNFCTSQYNKFVCSLHLFFHFLWQNFSLILKSFKLLKLFYLFHKKKKRNQMKKSLSKVIDFLIC